MTLTTVFCIAALEEAVAERGPLAPLNTEQGGAIYR
jgi:hypothetical protein